MQINKIQNSINISQKYNFRANPAATVPIETKEDKEKSNALMKMAGLGALAAVAIGGIIYYVKSGKKSSSVEKPLNEQKEKAAELIKKIFRKDGSLLKTVENDANGKLVSEKVYAKDGKTLKLETKYDEGQKIGMNVFENGKPKLSYVLTPQDNGYLKMEYDYKSNSIISDVFGNKKLQARNYTDIETGFIYRKIDFDENKRPILESFSRRTDGSIYERTAYDYLQNGESTDLEKYITKFNPDNGEKVKVIYSLNDNVNSVYNYKKGNLHEKIIKNSDGSISGKKYYDAETGFVTRNVLLENGKITRIENYNPKAEEDLLSEVLYINGKPSSAVSYEKGVKKSELLYNNNGLPNSKVRFYRDGAVESKFVYDQNGKKIINQKFYPDGETLREEERFYSNGNKKFKKLYFEKPNMPERVEIFDETTGKISKLVINNKYGNKTYESIKSPETGETIKEIHYYENKDYGTLKQPAKRSVHYYDNNEEVKVEQYDEKNRLVDLFDCKEKSSKQYIYKEDGADVNPSVITINYESINPKS